jgi:hypothetical protein
MIISGLVLVLFGLGTETPALWAVGTMLTVGGVLLAMVGTTFRPRPYRS